MAASSSAVNGTTEDGLTLTVLGCGTLGIAILSGILDSLQSSQTKAGTNADTRPVPPRLPARFVGCVRRNVSAERIRRELQPYLSRLEVLVENNLTGVQMADIIILGCKPQMFRDILDAPGIKEALAGKILISILAGVTVHQIEEHLYGSISDAEPTSQGRCRIIRVMPNTAASVRESMTVIANPVPPLPEPEQALITWIFSQIGRVTQLPPNTLDASTALCGSGPAFMALVLEAIADGAVAMGLPRAEAQTMAAQTMRGTTGMVLKGEHPAILRDKVSTPGGCTIGGLLVLEEGRVRGTVARAVREATVVASQLGKGVQGVNGTRF
ncbi:MAG: hypothetical protein Q9162_000131 [Coniocarpon cinnabarinum]